MPEARIFSRGVWAGATTIHRIRAEVEAERSTTSFAKKKETGANRREKAQADCVEDFQDAEVAFLAFHPQFANLAGRLAKAVADHATLVGSGTVARTTWDRAIGRVARGGGEERRAGARRRPFASRCISRRH